MYDSASQGIKVNELMRSRTFLIVFFLAFLLQKFCICICTFHPHLQGVPDPFQKFEDFPQISAQQLDTFYQAGFQAPTPIQVFVPWQ